MPGTARPVQPIGHGIMKGRERIHHDSCEDLVQAGSVVGRDCAIVIDGLERDVPRKVGGKGNLGPVFSLRQLPYSYFMMNVASAFA